MRTFVAVALAFGVAWTGFESTNADPGTSSSALQPKNEKGELKIGTVRSAKSLLGAEVTDGRGIVFGRIEDIALDIGQGKVQSVFVMPEGRSNQQRESLAISISMLQVPDNGEKIQLGSGFDTSTSRSTPGNPGDKSMVALFSALKDKPVENGRGERLGQLADLAVAPSSGLIAYTALMLDREPADTLFPIPLTAFVVPENTSKWVLELPQEIISHTPTFRTQEWPTAIPTAWTEYVHVRYGRSPVGGVERRTIQEKSN